MAMPPFNPAESYNTALQLHNQEFRTLSERTNIFLISQSIFVAALGLILTSLQWLPITLDIPALGIIIAGILYCAVYHFAGQSGSRGAFIWRGYMRKIEASDNNAPWKWFYNTYRRNQYPEYLLERPPLPSAWLASPSIFMAIWLGALTYVATNYKLAQPIEELVKYHQATLWLVVVLTSVAAVAWLVTAGLIVRNFLIWWHLDKEEK